MHSITKQSWKNLFQKIKYGFLVVFVLSFLSVGSFTIGKYLEVEKWQSLVEFWKGQVPMDVAEEESMENIVKRVMDEEGVSWLLAVRIIECESRWEKYFSEKMKDGSRDRGLFAFNNSPSRYGWVEDDCAFNPACSTRIFAQEVKAGNLKYWLCAKPLGLLK